MSQDNSKSAPAAAPVAGLYRDLVLLDPRLHAGKRVTSIQDWRMARETNAVALTVSEFAAAAREVPIGFVVAGVDDTGRQRLSAVALLGLQDKQNLFVTADGRWDAQWLPGYLRRFPFAYVRTDTERYSLAVDQAWAGFNDADGELLLTDTSEPTDYLQAVMRFLDRYEQDLATTQQLCDKLVELNLLRGAEINGELANGQKIQAGGFFMVDHAKLSALPDATVLEMHRNGMLGLIHAHLLSIGQIENLARRITG